MSAEAAVPAAALEAIRAPFAALDAAPIDPPALQPLTLLLEVSGEAMRERLIVVQGDGGPEMALRPDFTLPAARLHLESGKAEGRYRYEGKAFRASPAGAPDEPREFLQIGIEAFEAADAPRGDAEMATLAWRAAAAGGRRDLTLVFGDAALFSGLLQTLGLAEATVTRLRRLLFAPARLERALCGEPAPPMASAGADRLATLLASLPEPEAAAVLEDVWALAGIQPAGGRSAAEIVHRLAARSPAEGWLSLGPDEVRAIRGFLAIDDEPHAALATVAQLAGSPGPELDDAFSGWERRLDELAAEGVPRNRIRLRTAFAREFAYYDGVFFEVRSAGLGDERPVAAGGRYDGIFARLGSPLACGAVGCMVHPARAFAGAALR